MNTAAMDSEQIPAALGVEEAPVLEGEEHRSERGHHPMSTKARDLLASQRSRPRPRDPGVVADEEQVLAKPGPVEHEQSTAARASDQSACTGNAPTSRPVSRGTGDSPR